jgi:tRNA(Arg) A34 adenosine deaminase TadA
MSTPSDSDLRWLRRAIALSEQARTAGDEPFGSLLVGADGELLAEARNTVVTDRDLSAHPELKLAVWAGRHLDPETARRATMYTSCENCAMCSAAMVWAGLGTLVFALSGAALAELQGPRHAQLALSSRELFARASRPVAVRGPLLEQEALAVHAGYWA